MIALWWIMMNVTYCTQNDRHSRRLPPAYAQHGAEVAAARLVEDVERVLLLEGEEIMLDRLVARLW